MDPHQPFLPLPLYLLLWATCFGVAAYFDRRSAIPVHHAWYRYIMFRDRFTGDSISTTAQKRSQQNGAGASGTGGGGLGKWGLLAHKLQAALTCPGFIVFCQWYGSRLLANEHRADVRFVRLDDPVLNAWGPYDLSVPSTIVVYLVSFGALLVQIKHPRNIVIGLQTVGLTMAVRTLFLHLTPLASPSTIIPLVDPVQPYFALNMPGKDAKPLENDLMFSGHTSSCLATALVFRHAYLRRGALLLTGVLGAMVVLQHAHYSIDVLVAPFVVFAVWSFVVAMHKHDWRAAGLAQHGPGWGPIVRHRGDRKEN